MRRLLLLTIALAAFPVGLGIAVYAASGSSLGSPAASARVPTGTIARPSLPPSTTLDESTETNRSARCDEGDRSDECRPDPGATQTTTGHSTTSDSESGSDSDRSRSDDD